MIKVTSRQILNLYRKGQNCDKIVFHSADSEFDAQEIFFSKLWKSYSFVRKYHVWCTRNKKMADFFFRFSIYEFYWGLPPKMSKNELHSQLQHFVLYVLCKNLNSFCQLYYWGSLFIFMPIMRDGSVSIFTVVEGFYKSTLVQRRDQKL